MWMLLFPKSCVQPIEIDIGLSITHVFFSLFVMPWYIFFNTRKGVFSFSIELPNKSFTRSAFARIAQVSRSISFKNQTTLFRWKKKSSIGKPNQSSWVDYTCSLSHCALLSFIFSPVFVEHYTLQDFLIKECNISSWFFFVSCILAMRSFFATANH